MKVRTKEIIFSTSKEVELINITSKVQKILEESGVEEGVCILFAPHATGMLIINEDEPRLKEDILNALQRLIPKKANYKHDEIDDNAFSHILSALIGTEKVIPIKNGELQLGTWQEIFFVETDGPRERRKVIVTIIGS